MISINSYGLDRPKPEDSEFYIDHRLAYYSYEKSVEEPSQDPKTDQNSSGSEAERQEYNYSGQEDYQQDSANQDSTVQQLQSNANGASILIIIGSIFNDCIHVIIFFYSFNFQFSPGMFFGIFGFLISVAAFAAAVSLKSLKRLDMAVTIITVYFVFTLIEIIVLPIILTFINIPSQVTLVILTPVLILTIMGFTLTLLTRKYYYKDQEEKEILQEPDMHHYESSLV